MVGVGGVHMPGSRNSWAVCAFLACGVNCDSLLARLLRLSAPCAQERLSCLILCSNLTSKREVSWRSQSVARLSVDTNVDVYLL
jgi:hypothetical protein